MIEFGICFSVSLDPRMSVIMAPALMEILLILGSIFKSFFELPELFGCFMGAFFGVLRLSWKALHPKNIAKHIVL